MHMMLLVPYYKMAVRNVRTYSHEILKYVRAFYAYPPLHLLSVPIKEQYQRCCSHICAALGEGAVANRGVSRRAKRRRRLKGLDF